MEHDTKVQKSQSSTSAAPTSLFQPRPFAAEPETVAAEQPPDLQAKSDQTQGLGHSLANLVETTPRPPAAPTPPKLMKVQPKLTIGAVGDRYEQEADQVAAQVVQRLNAPKLERSPAIQREALPQEEEELQMKPMLQREVVPEEEEELQMKPTQEAIEGGDASADLESAINSARGSGQSMSPDLQAKMGEAMGADFSGVKIHANATADRLNQSIQARAFTTGNDIFFKSGEYNPGSRGGQELLAHELTHVIQQNHTKLARKTQRPRPVVQRSLGGGRIAREIIAQSTPWAAPQITQGNQITQPIQRQTIQRQTIQRQTIQRQTIQRQLMSAKEFHAVTKWKWNKRRGSALNELEKMIKGYQAQPDAGKCVYLTRLIEHANAYLVDVVNDGLDPAGPRVVGVRRLIDNAYQELMQLEQSGVRQKGSNNQPSPVDRPVARKYEDINGQQYRITGRAPSRIIEQVRRYQDEQGKVRYAAIGEVVDFSSNMPVISYYAEPVSLGDWYPQITQLNGMNVKPTTGIRDAVSLQTQVNEKIEESLGSQGLTIGQDTIDVLYTYSANLGLVGDLIDCVKGKIGFGDQVIELQKQVMLDAVMQKQRVVVSAHSRGTIKTDNAVRLAHRHLFENYRRIFSGARQQEAIELSKEFYQALPGDIRQGIGEADAIAYFFPLCASELAEQNVLNDMDSYIKLIYAGNAVQYPSSKIKIKMFVGKKDLVVSGCVGTYTNWGSRFASGNDQTSLKKVSGGHSFSNYFRHVGEEVARDMLVPLGM
jgi:hypothetical protein